MIKPPRSTFRVAPQYQPLMRELGLDADGIFHDRRIVAWRKLEDRENCTLDARRADGEGVRLHVKRYQAVRGSTPAEEEVKGHTALTLEKIPTAALVGWGVLADQRSFTIWEDLAGFIPADKMIESGVGFERLLVPTADLAAKMHRIRLHHRDLYLCHFMANLASGAGATAEVRLIDTARVRRLGGFLSHRRWIVKDLAQFWYSTLKLRVTDAQRHEWLARYAQQRGDGTTAGGLLAAIERKSRQIARHNKRLNEAQPTRNISIPSNPAAAATSLRPRMDNSSHPFFIRRATPDDAAAMIEHIHQISEEPGIPIPISPGEFTVTVEEERKILSDTAASNNGIFLVAEAGGQIIGVLNCIGGSRQATRHAARLGVTIRREWRNRGVGTAMLQHVTQWALDGGVVTRIELKVYARNESAKRLYEHAGFFTEGRLQKAVFQDGKYEDEWVMALLL